MQNTSNLRKQESWINKEKSLINALESQPLIILLRISEKDLEEYNLDIVFPLINKLISEGIKNIEIAWSPHPNWPKFVKEIFRVINNITFGAASINKNSALRLITELGFAYAMSPFFDENMLQEAKELGQLLIPGVFSPSEIQKAINSNCSIIKLFPASSLGVNYLNNLKIPLNSLPFVIAAGGLKAQDINPWLQSGHNAIVLGRGLFNHNGIDPILKKWLKKNSISI